MTLMLRLAKEGKEMSVVNDQVVSPTYTKDLAEKIREMIEERAPVGIYHLTNEGAVSWHDFAALIFRLADVHPQLRAVTSAERPASVPRPQMSVLGRGALVAAGLAPMRSLEDAVWEYLGEVAGSAG